MFRQVLLFYDSETMLLSSLFSINVTTRSPQVVVYFRLFLKLIFLCVCLREWKDSRYAHVFNLYLWANIGKSGPVLSIDFNCFIWSSHLYTKVKL